MAGEGDKLFKGLLCFPLANSSLCEAEGEQPLEEIKPLSSRGHKNVSSHKEKLPAPRSLLQLLAH
jgi:hypothetical protein